jgi:predicted PurR-regulated permease PerM
VNTDRLSNAFLGILVVIAVGAVLSMTGNIVMPLVVAALLSFALNPVVDRLKRWGVPRPIGIGVVIAIILAFGFLVGVVLYSSVQSLLREFPAYQQRFIELYDDLVSALDLPADIINRFDLPRIIGGFALDFGGGFLSFAGGLTLMVVFILFLLLERPYFRSKLLAAIQSSRTERVSRVIVHINRQVGRYIGVKLLVSGMTGFIVFWSFYFIGVDFAFIWGILTFLFNFIPTIGSISISVLSYLFVLIQFFPSWTPIVLAAGAMTGTQLVIGNILDPKLQGDRLNLSPVLILVSLLFWNWLWGVLGMFLAVPLTAAIKIAFENIPGLEWIAVLMSTGDYDERMARKMRRRNRRTEERLERENAQSSGGGRQNDEH